jgi:hypothetical protein
MRDEVCFFSLSRRNGDLSLLIILKGLTRRYQSGYQLALLIKDMKITKDVIQSTGFDTGLPELAIGYLEDAIAGLKDDADHTECLKGWEKRAGIELRKSDQPTEKVVEEKGL